MMQYVNDMTTRLDILEFDYFQNNTIIDYLLCDVI